MTRLASFALAVLLAVPTLATAQQNIQLRGTVTAVDGDAVTVETASGETATVTMAADYLLIVYEPIAVTDLEPGDFLSIPALPGADGSTVALSINVFPEEMRGAGEGRSSWDAGEGSTMVNATIGTVTGSTGGNDLTVTYQSEEQVVTVPDGTPITRMVPTPSRRLAPGDQAIVALRGTGDAMRGAFAGVMADGSLPRL